MDTPDGVTAVFSVRDLREAIATPADGIVSRSIFVDDDVRVVLFSFAPGQRLTDHTAAVPVLTTTERGSSASRCDHERCWCRYGCCFRSKRT